MSLVLLTSCASETTSDSSPTSVPTSITASALPATPTEVSAATAPPEAIIPPITIAVTAPPVERAAENPGFATNDYWIARGTMSEDTVELVWASIASDDVRYVVYRVPSLGVDLELVDVQDLTRVYAGSDTQFVDRTVEPNTFYSYILVPEIDNLSLSRRWTNALTTTDTEPPAEVEIVSTETTSQGLTICWSPSSDNVEFASYSVSLVLDSGELQYLGGGADLSQTCFVDTRPLPGASTYAVQAVDFHDNRSDPTFVIIEA